jgi:hypothetical protein
MNLSIDHFDPEYIEEMSSTTCPNCGAYSRLGALLTRFENNSLRLDCELVPKPLPVILYLGRPSERQSKTFTWIRNWLALEGQAGVAQLEAILDQRLDLEADTYGVKEELRELLLEWRVFNSNPSV